MSPGVGGNPCRAACADLDRVVPAAAWQAPPLSASLLPPLASPPRVFSGQSQDQAAAHLFRWLSWVRGWMALGGP